MRRFFTAILLTLAGTLAFAGQTMIELADDSSIPSLIRNLPEWESVFDKAVLARKAEPLKAELGDREFIDLIDFTGGTEAVTAPYDAGKLLLIEYPTPQASVAADESFNQKLASAPSETTVYRRIGNYNAFVFDVTDPVAANSLLDQIKYEKTVQWLGKDPKANEKWERYLARSMADLFLTTTVAIVGGFVGAVVAGLAIGVIFFRIREQRREAAPVYSDAGSMVRLNLDELTSQIDKDRLLDQ